MIGYLLAALTGFTLGLMGGGGSVLTVPVLIYALGIDPKQAIALSLAIVGATSLIGVISHFKHKNIQMKVVGIFAPVAMIGTFAGARLSKLLTAEVQLMMFTVVMLVAAVFMIRPKKDFQEGEDQEVKPLPLAITAFFVGILTGVVGIGGGFMIVPALVILAKMDMRKAVGTSLFIINLNAFSGFAGYVGMIEIPWLFLAKFIALSGVGIILGAKMANKVSQPMLKKGFAVLLLVMGSFIFIREFDKITNPKTEQGQSPSKEISTR